ncbi:hypothetical protein [Morganella morganii]|uniref:hypothetical protein n=1 Tax=Morganella morganii TaxID=582 RepID=UPI001BDB790F|nr:hypothetical protein [Morganella morganii]MBT0497621.1 hypothetical protein [Morganella morganii subsp. morganii]QWL97985.1 hypothetical protein IZ183_05705 [Morganella morganii subsp. morganii]
MQRLEISGGQTSSRTVLGRKVTTHEGFVTGSLSQLLSSSAWSMNELVEFMINNEYMDDFTDELIKAGHGSSFFARIAEKMRKEAA